jgi:hypothetical protein
VLVTVNDRDTLGQDLLSIVGQRVAHKLSKLDAQMVVELMSNVNPALSTWLKSMVSFLSDDLLNKLSIYCHCFQKYIIME